VLRASSPRPTPVTVSPALLAELLAGKDTSGMAMDWIKADLTPCYASLLALFDPEKREALRDLLAERFAERTAVAAFGDNPAGATSARDFEAEFKGKLDALVGPADAELFLRTELKPLSWDRIQRLDDRLRYEAAPLNKEQFTTLWPILSSEISYGAAPSDEASGAALLQRKTEGNQRILDQAGQLGLSTAQIGSLSRLLTDDLATLRVEVFARVKAAQSRAAPVPTGK